MNGAFRLGSFRLMVMIRTIWPWLGRWSINVIYVLYGHLALLSPGRVQEVLKGYT